MVGSQTRCLVGNVFFIATTSTEAARGWCGCPACAMSKASSSNASSTPTCQSTHSASRCGTGNTGDAPGGRIFKPQPGSDPHIAKRRGRYKHSGPYPRSSEESPFFRWEPLTSTLGNNQKIDSFCKAGGSIDNPTIMNYACPPCCLDAVRFHC